MADELNVAIPPLFCHLDLSQDEFPSLPRQFLADEAAFGGSVEQVSAWLEKFATAVRWNQVAELSQDVWTQSESEELRKMMRQVGRIYRRHHAGNLIHYRKSKLWVTLSSLAALRAQR